jgi:hypothetical protein
MPQADPEPVASAPSEPIGTAEAPDAAPDEPSCPRPDHGAHCVWMATTPPNPFRAKHVAKKLKADGFDAVADGDRIIVHADDNQLKRLFGVEIPHERRAASSSNRMRCMATVPDGAQLDARYRGEVGEVLLDDPSCEL